MRRFLSPALLVVGVIAMLVALVLLSKSTQNSTDFDRLHVLLLLLNAAGVLVLLVLISINLFRLISQYRKHEPGSRLTARLVAMFLLLAMVPVVLVYYFSLQFINKGIDSWFDVRVEKALDDALELSRSALDQRVRELLIRTERMADELTTPSPVSLTARMEVLRQASGAADLTLFGSNSRILATSSSTPTTVVPEQPSDEMMLQLRQGRPYVGLDPAGDRGLRIRAIVPVVAMFPGQSDRYLQALFPVADRQNGLAQNVQDAYSRYHELTYLRTPLKISFILSLSLVLLLSLLAAVWGAFYAARRLVAPIQDLAKGTRAVARGDFNTRLPMPARDEVGFLVLSFNEMTSRLADAREAARHSQQQVESERGYLQAVLARLSSGVIAFDSDLRLRTANAAASDILGVPLERSRGKPLARVTASDPVLAQFLEVFRRHLDAGETEWREEVVVNGAARGRRVLMCSCTTLPDLHEGMSGHVVVFDDLTDLIQAQREAAWGEVARRLAHEIKNPLTPIQLAAERLRRRYLDKLAPEDLEVFDRATHTIVQQVEAMKFMVNAFSEYARSPELELAPLDINALVSEVADLYRGRDADLRIRLDLEAAMPLIDADSGRVRQILHNLLKNSVEALGGRDNGRISISTRLRGGDGGQSAEVRIEDNGPGFDTGILEQAFEPYVTSKPKGTGLGLAIVKKLAEEHGGSIRAENLPTGGARVIVRLPVDEAARSSSLARAARHHAGA